MTYFARCCCGSLFDQSVEYTDYIKAIALPQCCIFTKSSPLRIYREYNPGYDETKSDDAWRDPENLAKPKLDLLEFM